jgi:poly-gamma-glutamate system protein
VHVLLSMLALASLFVVEQYRPRVHQPLYDVKLAAATLASDCFLEIKRERLRRGMAIDPLADPAESGLIGSLRSEVTTRSGKLSAKQTAVNPNFAAVVVQLLNDAGVQEGDTIAIGFSGSFPALNVALLAAAEVMKLNLLSISSVSASQWGANEPEFLWPDMEKVLYDKKRISARSVAMSMGGIDDRGLGLTDAGRELLSAAIRKQKLKFLQPTSYEDSVNLRMALYKERARGAAIKTYVNVGGTTSSIGMEEGRKGFLPGVSREVPAGTMTNDSVMARFIVEERVPVVNLREVELLARTYGLPIAPAKIPVVGEGGVFLQHTYNKHLATGVLAVLLASIWLFMRTDIGYRLLQSSRAAPEDTVSGPVV